MLHDCGDVLSVKDRGVKYGKRRVGAKPLPNVRSRSRGGSCPCEYYSDACGARFEKAKPSQSRRREQAKVSYRPWNVGTCLSPARCPAAEKIRPRIVAIHPGRYEW